MAYAIENPGDVAGVVLLAPVVYPWSVHTVAWHDNFMLAALLEGTSLGAGPTSGPLFAHTLALPFGKGLMAASVKSAFAPQLPPRDYMARSGGNLELRPSNFVANSQDVDLLDQHLAAQAQRYGEIQVPVLILAGDQDAVVPPTLHALRLGSALPHAEVMMLRGVGHMIHYAAPEQVRTAIANLVKRLGRP